MSTKLNVADNSGVNIVYCISVNGNTGDFVASVGDIIIVSARDVISTSKIKKGDKCYGVIVRQKSKIITSDGTSVSFDDNAVVLIDKTGEPIGSRVFGPVSRKIKDKFPKIASLAFELV